VACDHGTCIRRRSRDRRLKLFEHNSAILAVHGGADTLAVYQSRVWDVLRVCEGQQVSDYVG
jgi:hypothetical protein